MPFIKFSSETSIFVKKKKKKKLVQQASKCGADSLYKASFSALQAVHPYPNQNWAPLPQINHVDEW